MNKSNNFSTLVLIFLAIALGGCGSIYHKQVAPPDIDNNSLIQSKASKDLIIFFDGTANDWKSRTNVRRLYEVMVFNASPKFRMLYVEGVGNSKSRILGSAFGWGMKPRILEGLKFLAENYKKGDRIYLFGFSRGAHQARALAGMISYCGVPSIKKPEIPQSVLNQYWNICKKIDEIEPKLWAASELQALPIDFLGKRVKGLESQWAPIEFIGVWDTVPGSSFKDFGTCSEKPDRKKGTRYKSGSYPNVKFIAHAVAIDEKRTRYRPLLLCQPTNKRTTVREAWFSGAHSDVGGGYKDSMGLSGPSLNWMIDLLEQHSSLPLTFPKPYGHAGGLAHSPIDSWFWRLLDKPDIRDAPEDACQHPSVTQRSELDDAPIKRGSNTHREKYTPAVVIKRECIF